MPGDEEGSQDDRETAAMSKGSRPDGPLADFEIAGGLRAAEARWQRKAHTTTITSGELESEERRDREPEDPDRRRTYRNVRRVWEFRAWLTDALRREPS
jgi:hypothetical protein